LDRMPRIFRVHHIWLAMGTVAVAVWAYSATRSGSLAGDRLTVHGQRAFGMPGPFIAHAPLLQRMPVVPPGYIRVECELIDGMLHISTESGTEKVVDLTSQRCVLYDGDRWVGDTSRLPSGSKRWYSSDDTGWVSSGVYGSRRLWRVHLGAKTWNELTDVERGGQRVFALRTGTGKSIPNELEPNRALYALSASDGRVLWRKSAGRGSSAVIAGAGSGLVVVAVTGFPDADDAIPHYYILMRASSGDRLGVLREGYDDGWAVTEVARDSRWLAISHGNKILGYDLSSRSGRPVWSKKLSFGSGFIWTSGKDVIITPSSTAGILTALDPRNGKQLWTISSSGSNWNWENAKATGNGKALVVVRKEYSGQSSIVRIDQGKITWATQAGKGNDIELADGDANHVIAALIKGHATGIPHNVLLLDAKSGHIIAHKEFRNNIDVGFLGVHKDMLCLVAGKPAEGYSIFFYSLSRLATSLPLPNAR